MFYFDAWTNVQLAMMMARVKGWWLGVEPVWAAELFALDAEQPTDGGVLHWRDDVLLVDVRSERELAVSRAAHALTAIDEVHADERRLVALICTAGVRSLAAAAELRRRHPTLRVANVVDGLLGAAAACTGPRASLTPLVDADGRPTHRLHTYSAAFDALANPLFESVR